MRLRLMKKGDETRALEGGGTASAIQSPASASIGEQKRTVTRHVTKIESDIPRGSERT